MHQKEQKVKPKQLPDVARKSWQEFISFLFASKLNTLRSTTKGLSVFCVERTVEAPFRLRVYTMWLTMWLFCVTVMRFLSCFKQQALKTVTENLLMRITVPGLQRPHLEANATINCRVKSLFFRERLPVTLKTCLLLRVLFETKHCFYEKTVSQFSLWSSWLLKKRSFENLRLFFQL